MRQNPPEISLKNDKCYVLPAGSEKRVRRRGLIVIYRTELFVLVNAAKVWYAYIQMAKLIDFKEEPSDCNNIVLDVIIDVLGRLSPCLLFFFCEAILYPIENKKVPLYAEQNYLHSDIKLLYLIGEKLKLQNNNNVFYQFSDYL